MRELHYYSKSTGGFYVNHVHGEDGMPVDVVEISKDEWQTLLQEQSNGKQIVPGVHGRPVAVERELVRDIPQERAQGLKETDWLVARHRDELEMGVTTSLSAEQYQLLQVWRQTLRNLPNQADYPNVEVPPRPI